MSKYKAVINSSWDENHKQNFGKKPGYLVCKDERGLPVVVVVPNLLGESIEDTKMRAEIIASALTTA